MHVEEAFATRRFSSSVTAHSTNPTVRPLWVATSGRPNASGTGEGDTGPQNPLPVFRSCLFAEPARRLTSLLPSGSVGFARIAAFMTQTCAFFPPRLVPCARAAFPRFLAKIIKGTVIPTNEKRSVARFTVRMEFWPKDRVNRQQLCLSLRLLAAGERMTRGDNGHGKDNR